MHTMSTAKRKAHQQWLLELTAIPTAAGREQRVIAWVNKWIRARRHLALREDQAGNLIITRKSSAPKRSGLRPIFITAHLDHPAFVVRGAANDDTIELEFRGGVHDPYFRNALIDIFDSDDRPHRAKILNLDPQAKPFKRVIAQLQTPADSIHPGDIGRWTFESQTSGRGRSSKKKTVIQQLPRVAGGLLHTFACDDLAAVAAALATLEALKDRKNTEHVGVLLTRAEEIGFIGAIAACKGKTISKQARLICLENSRSFAESPIGAGPIVRVGDKMSVFSPALTNRISLLMMEYQKDHPDFKWQRKLMPGGTCEATTFSAFGHESTCICLPLGNYHNMIDIDGALAGGKTRSARVGPEFISLDDYHGMIEMLIVCATQLDSADAPSLTKRMNGLIKDYGFVLQEGE